MSSPLMLWNVAHARHKQDLRRAAAWHRAHSTGADSRAIDGGRETRPRVFKRLRASFALRPRRTSTTH